jgi:hypothetical protein
MGELPRSEDHRADAERYGKVFRHDLTDALDMPIVPGVTLWPAASTDAAALQDAMHTSGVYPVDGAR